jgi:hypothetical protein
MSVEQKMDYFDFRLGTAHVRQKSKIALSP